MKNFQAITLLFFTITIFVFPQPVTASCIEIRTPEEGFERSDAVFTGGVVYISSANGIWIDSVTQTLMSLGMHPADIDGKVFQGRRIVFEVDRAWKGVTTSSITIRTGYSSGNSSSYPFELGDYYLVYASHAYGDPEKYLLTSRCSRTLSSPNNSEDIAYLNTLPTLELSYFPAIVRTIDGSFIIIVLLLLSLIYKFKRKSTSRVTSEKI